MAKSATTRCIAFVVGIGSFVFCCVGAMVAINWLEFISAFYGVTFTDRIFAAKFGVDTAVCSYLYDAVQPFQISHLMLLMTLNFLKCYPTFDAGHVEWQCSRTHYLMVVERGLDALYSSLDEVCNFFSASLITPLNIFSRSTGVTALPPAYIVVMHMQLLTVQFVQFRSTGLIGICSDIGTAQNIAGIV